MLRQVATGIKKIKYKSSLSNREIEMCVYTFLTGQCNALLDYFMAKVDPGEAFLLDELCSVQWYCCNEWAIFNAVLLLVWTLP